MKCQYLVAVTHSISDRNVLSGRDLVTRDGTKLQNISYVGGERVERVRHMPGTCSNT